MQPVAPTSIDIVNTGFLKSFVSASVPITGPRTATIIVTIEAAYPQ